MVGVFDREKVLTCGQELKDREETSISKSPSGNVPNDLKSSHWVSPLDISTKLPIASLGTKPSTHEALWHIPDPNSSRQEKGLKKYNDIELELISFSFPAIHT